MKRYNIAMSQMLILSIMAVLGTILGAGIASGQIVPDPTWLEYGDHDVNIDLGIGEMEAYIIPIERGDRVILDLTVAEGGPVDFYSMNNYSLYLTVKDDPGMSTAPADLYFMEEGEYSQTNSLWISYEYTAIYDDTLIILVDNSNMVENGAVPTGDVLVSGSIIVKENVWTMENIGILLVMVVVIIIIFAGFRIPGRKRREAEQKKAREMARARHREQVRQRKEARNPAPRRAVKRITRVKKVTGKPKK